MAALVSRIVGLDPGIRPGAEPGVEILGIIHGAIARRPAALQRQLRLFFFLLRWLPAVRYLAPFDRLAAQQQTAVLTWFQDAPIGLLRKGFWGVKALVFMGYYGRPGIGPELGYRPSSNGNELLRA